MRSLLPATLLLAAAVPAENLVSNGGFEQGLKGWEVSNPSGVLKAEADGKVRRSGKASAHLVKRGGARLLADGLVFALSKIPAGAKVSVSAQVRGKDMKNGWVKFSAYDEAGEQLLDAVAVNEANLRGTFDWTEVKKEFEIPAKAVRADLALWLYLDGEAWLDEVEVIPLGKGAPPPKKEPAKALDSGIRKWLDARAVKVRSLDEKAPLGDLAPLKEILKDARIVQLGENTHGDGACFEAKVRLVRFLHEEMGFEVLAFESGLFECESANGLLRKGDAAGAMDASIFGIWHTAPVRRLFRYLVDRAKVPKPLHLSGFDCRWSGEIAARFPDE
ncbi:MAG: erythromycin esterase family protein, partial [Planctomycetes bacterium]|nr:erythromycin esterase family protein [Planctomycetota bacterium]